MFGPLDQPYSKIKSLTTELSLASGLSMNSNPLNIPQLERSLTTSLIKTQSIWFRGWKRFVEKSVVRIFILFNISISWQIPKFEMDSDTPLQSVLVHTNETIRVRFFIDMLLEKKQPVMLVGTS